jgi:hypothetical protein
MSQQRTSMETQHCIVLHMGWGIGSGQVVGRERRRRHSKGEPSYECAGMQGHGPAMTDILDHNQVSDSGRVFSLEQSSVLLNRFTER